MARATRGRGIGRALLGLGLMLLALRLMGEVTAPLQHSRTLALVIAGLGEAPLVAALLAAGLAVLSASSLAVVLLVMVLAGGGLIETVPALALVAGANVGGAVTPWLAVAAEGAGGAADHARQPRGADRGGSPRAALRRASGGPSRRGRLRSRPAGHRGASGLQRGAPPPVPAPRGSALPPRRAVPARSAGGPSAARPSSTRACSTRPPWRSPSPRARLCGWATSWARCSSAAGRRCWPMTNSRRRRSRGSSPTSTG